ncbi:DUF3352 domain-containing protein [Patescibacteria group bacterium]|nr:DUF3352 domain-containing protein [Patescibacteria group bacterium]
MDIKQNVPPAGGTTSQQKKSNEEFLASHLLVRTMEKDMAALSKNSPLASLSPVGIPIAKPAAPQPFLPPKIVAPPAMDATKKIIPPLDLPVAKGEIKPAAPTIPLTPKPAPPPPLPPAPPSVSPPAPPPKPPVQKPLPPLPTPVLPITEIPEPGRKLAWGKIALIAGLLIVVSLSIGGWIYWKNIKPEPTASVTPSATSTPLVLPSPLFSMDEQREIELAAAQETNLNEITQLFDPLKEASVFAQIIFETSANGQKKIPTLSELSALTGFETLALSLADYLQPEKYTFFIYNQTEAGSSPFSGGQRGRLGLVVALKDAQKAKELASKLKELEPFIPTNLKGLLADKSVYLPDTVSFLDNTYKNIPIRYINFPTAALSIDYAVVNDMLVVATSKESMYAAIDRLLNVATSSMADWQTYRNDEYGYEVKYPNYLYYAVNPSYPNITFFDGSKIESPFEAYSPIVSLRIRVEEAMNMDIEKIINDFKKDGDFTDIQIKIGGAPARKIRGILTAESQATGELDIEVFISKGEKAVQISFVSKGSLFSEKSFNQVLSTFKFVSQ